MSKTLKTTSTAKATRPSAGAGGNKIKHTDATGNGKQKIHSALSLHLNNLVQRTQKNLNTGVFTHLNPGASPMTQTGIGMSNSVKNKRDNRTF